MNRETRRLEQHREKKMTIYRGYEVGDDEETEGKKAGVDAIKEEEDD